MSTQFQNLSNEFNVLLTQYQEIYQKYIDAISSGNTVFKTVDNLAFNGQTRINILNNTDVSNCQTVCSANSVCSGATFNTVTNNCTLSSGAGDIIQTQQSKAIIEEGMYYSYQLQKLNTRLIHINNQLMNTSENNYNDLQNSQQQNIEQENIVKNNYQTLEDERIQIEKMVREYETLNRAYENGNINVTSYYYRYIALLIITILLVFLLVKFSVTGSSQSGGSSTNYLYNVYKFFRLS